MPTRAWSRPARLGEANRGWSWLPSTQLAQAPGGKAPWTPSTARRTPAAVQGALMTWKLNGTWISSCRSP